MRISRNGQIALIATFGLCLALPAAAQYVGILQSAETMNQGNYKLMAAPIMILGKNGAKDETGIALRGGYAFTKHFDAEANLGFFKNGTYVGVDGEYWIFRGSEANSGADVSLTGGLHWLFGSNNASDLMGFEITPQASYHVTPNLELGVALDASFETIKDVPSGLDDSFTRLNLVPGIEYRLSDSFDLEAEFGIGMNDNSSDYVGAGITYYIQ
jgi:hypothetical protein